MVQIKVLKDNTGAETLKSFARDILEDIFHYPAQKLEDFDNIQKSFCYFLVASEDDELVGMLGIKKDGADARVSRMYIKKSMRNKGLGSKLIKKAISFCRKNKFKRVFLTTYKQMNAVGFYQKCGFKTYKEEGDVIYLERFL